MNAVIYEITVHEGIMGYIHDQSSTIKEIFIPDKSLAVNVYNSILNIFVSNNDRYSSAIKIGECEIEESVVENFERVIRLKELCKREIERFLKNGKE